MENLSRHGYSGVPTEAFVVATQPTQAQKQSQVDGGTGFLGSMKLYVSFQLLAQERAERNRY